MIRIAILILVQCFLLTGVAQGQDVTVPSEGEGKLSTILNRMTLLSVRGVPPEDLGYTIRVFRVDGAGECGATPDSCPKSYVYIAVSELGESPTYNLFRLPDAYGWSFVAWEDFPAGEPSREKFILLQLSRRLVAKDPSKGWFTDEKIEVRFNAYIATMRPN